MISELIRQAEKKWMKILYNEVVDVFEKNPLPSHDQTHHYRVWIFTKELVFALFKNGFSFNLDDLEKLIIAVFFHDTGLTITHALNHGIESRKLCENFLIKQNIKKSAGYAEMLEAIEMHDDKSYLDEHKVNLNTIYRILAASDDLDAYGAIGVYRYLEIYMLRKIPISEISDLVIENLKSRFMFLELHYSQLKYFVEKQNERMNYTLNFYSDLVDKKSGAIELVQFLQEKVINPKGRIESIFNKKMKNNLKNEYIQSFITRGENELKSFME